MCVKRVNLKQISPESLSKSLKTHNEYDANYYTNSPVKNPKGPNTGQYRVLRGGSWHYRSNYLRVAYRNYDLPSDRYSSLGFRCVLGFPTVEQ